jgi:hypothetical protein
MSVSIGNRNKYMFDVGSIAIKDTVTKIKKINSKFTTPLSNKEIDQIIKSILKSIMSSS